MKYENWQLQEMALTVIRSKDHGFLYPVFIARMVLKTGYTASFIKNKISQFAGAQH